MITAEIEGVAELGAALKKLGKKVRTDIAREAIVMVATPMVNAAKRHARKDTGTLEKSIGMRLKQKKRNSGFFVAIGPRRGFAIPKKGGKKVEMQDPIRYGHLVEFGHLTNIGSVAADPFMRPGWQETKGDALPTMARVYSRRIREEVARVKSKPRKKS